LSANSYQVLGIHKRDCHKFDNPLDWCRCSERREQLLSEITALEQKLAEIESAGAEIDYSLRQTCREMIHSRQQLYLQLQR
jgi:hypothetical protein